MGVRSTGRRTASGTCHHDGMYAVIALFEMPRPVGEHQQEQLQGIVERISAEAGFVAGYWTHDGTRSINMIILDSLEAAEARAEDVRGNEQQQRAYGIIPIEVTVAEVVASAVA
jgi:hypothetical protein